MPETTRAHRRSKESTGVRLAVPDDMSEMRRTLVEAFMDDPVVRWVYPDQNRRESNLDEWYEIMLTAGLRAGHTYTVGSGRAVAIWAPPSVQQLVEWDRDGKKMADMLGRHLGDKTRYALAGLMKIETAHPYDTPHFYLSMLGTRPTAQGKGLAGSLLDEVLGRCDREGWPAYLETATEPNVRFYERRGFRVTGETELPDDGPTVWFMWRDVRPPAG
jgi:ribosomal protein S18 acetylase RimI-like enzyme